MGGGQPADAQGYAPVQTRLGSAQDWEQAFKLESLSIEVASLVQDRWALRQQLDGVYEGLRALSTAVELLSADFVRSPRSGAKGAGCSSVALDAQLERARRTAESSHSGGGFHSFEKQVHYTEPPAWDDGDQEALSRESLVDQARKNQSHRLEQSIWDSSLFIGLGALGYFDTTILFLCWLTNLVVQLLFTAIICSRFHESPYNEELIGSLTKWRAIYGHDTRFMNPVTNEALVASVCSGSDFLTESQEQMQLYKRMREFLPSYVPESLYSFITTQLNVTQYHGGHSEARSGGVPSDQFYFSGKDLCMMLVLLWTMLISKEVRKAYRTHSAVWTKANATEGGSILMRNAKGSLVLLSISRFRATMVTLFITLPRMCIAAALLVGGSYFIVAAENMEDLILNALSLEFIITTDELIFAVTSPKTVVMMVAEVAPLPMGSYWYHFRSTLKIAGILSIFSYVALVSVWVVDPVVHNMQDAMTVMCGGDIDFVSRRYSDGITHTVVSDAKPLDQLEFTYGYCSVLQRTGLGGARQHGCNRSLIEDRGNFTCSGVTEQPLAREAFSTGDLKLYGSLVLRNMATYQTTACVDTNLHTDARIRVLLQEATGKPFLTACSEAVLNCHRPSTTGFDATLVRLYCPATCNCAGRGQFFVGSGEGCPKLCKDLWHDMLLDKSLPCKDLPKSKLSESSEWKSYWEAVVDYIKQFGDTAAQDLATQLKSKVKLTRELGCRTFHSNYTSTWDFCDPENMKMKGGLTGQEHRTIRAFCPETCGCEWACRSAGDCRDCPRSCSNPGTLLWRPHM